MAIKRANGEGSIRQLPSGKWYGQIMDGYQLSGKKNIVGFTGYKKADVIQQIREYWKQRDEGALPSQHMPFDRWADVWYEDYKTQVQPSTYSGYRYTLNCLKSFFGTKELQKIKPLEIGSYFDYLIQVGYSQSYITKCRAMLIQIFDLAETNEIIATNPARKAKIRRLANVYSRREQYSSKDAFSEKEIVCMKAKLHDDLLGNSILLMIGTGMRTQELLALTRADISMDGSMITINKAIKLVNGRPQLGPPKSERGNRVIPIPWEYRKHAIFLRIYGGQQFIWESQREDRLFDPGVFRKKYYAMLRELPEVRVLSPHCCRHTYVSLLEKRGVPMEQIARLAGHTKISTTDGYLHTDQATLAAAVECLNN